MAKIEYHRAVANLVAGPCRLDPVERRERAAALRLLLHRYSLSPKYLGEPGPTHEELQIVDPDGILQRF